MLRDFPPPRIPKKRQHTIVLKAHLNMDAADAHGTMGRSNGRALSRQCRLIIKHNHKYKCAVARLQSFPDVYGKRCWFYRSRVYATHIVCYVHKSSLMDERWAKNFCGTVFVANYRYMGMPCLLFTVNFVQSYIVRAAFV